MHACVRELSRLMNLVPAMCAQRIRLIYGSLVVHVIHGDILIRTLYYVGDLCIVEFYRHTLRSCVADVLWNPQGCGEQSCFRGERAEAPTRVAVHASEGGFRIGLAAHRHPLVWMLQTILIVALGRAPARPQLAA